MTLEGHPGLDGGIRAWWEGSVVGSDLLFGCVPFGTSANALTLRSRTGDAQANTEVPPPEGSCPTQPAIARAIFSPPCAEGSIGLA